MSMATDAHRGAHSRRQFLLLVPVVAAAVVRGQLWAAPAHRLMQGTHPEPRPGVDASRVLTREQLTDHPKAIPVFDMVRTIPRVVDGIRCHCGCGELPEKHSLLSCFEGDGMARMCQVCQDQARLAYKLSRQGKTLNQIRAAIDAEFS